MSLKNLDAVTFHALTSNFKTLTFFVQLLYKNKPADNKAIYQTAKVAYPQLSQPVEVIAEEIASSIQAYFNSQVDTPDIVPTVYRTVADVLENTLLPTIEDESLKAYTLTVISGDFVK